MNNYGKTIVGFTEYSITENGDIYSHKYNKVRKMNLTPNGNGYLVVRLSQVKGVSKTFSVHRLVAETYINKPSEDLVYVRHLNDNKTDNRVENLAWGTAKQNGADAISNFCGNGKKKLNEDLVIQIIDLIKLGVLNSTIANLFGVSQGTICDIRYLISWKHIPR